MKEIARFIKEERMMQGISLRKLAEKCGVCFPHIHRIENGRMKNCEIDTLSRILDALGYKLRITAEPKKAEKCENAPKICDKKRCKNSKK